MVEDPVLLWLALLPVGFMLGSRCSKCCAEPPCSQIEAQSGGAGTTVTTHTFPSEELQLQFEYDAYSVPDEFIVKIAGETIFSTDGAVSGSDKYCFTKPAGQRDVEVTVNGPSGTAWKYTLKCQCDPPPPPPGPCCVLSSPCDGSAVTVGTCTGSALDCCVSSGIAEDLCLDPSPPGVTLCGEGVFETRETPPYDCVAGPNLDPLGLIIVTFYALEIDEASPDPGGPLEGPA